MRLTGRGLAVSVAAVLLLAAGLWLRLAVLTTLGAVAAAAVLAAIALTVPQLAVEVHRVVHPDRVERGRPALARLRVRSTGNRRQPGFRAEDAAGGERRHVRLPGLLPGVEVTRTYELPTATRGKLTVGPLTLHRADPFDLARRRLPVTATATLWVHPRRHAARAMVAGVPRHHHEGTPDAALRGSVEQLDVREYVPGDEVRHLHWKATARTGRLMVRDLADPRRARTTVLLDNRPGVLTPAFFEEAVDLTASLLCASARATQDTRLVTWTGRDLAVQGGPLATRRLLDELSEVRQDAARQDPALRPGGGLVLVTGGGAAVEAVLARRAEFAAVVVVAVGGWLEVPSGVRVLRALGAAQAVRQWNDSIG
ncbi:DUF58 domain-containing protein [Actinoplanes sp. NBRC 103695]|uniref:DUF58 domain-containing protein n=1 Tax=Actinoplanes sp. NBRC 103695 TaxID=3032202 RepID=UPI0024A383A5|nr:DUF58 domain-containing protein [Actinoplanes sp. NBRC 103695]GLY97609.1 hypothetical protein Acsp02_48630 [Actinoplanes sp. NBRC 103695]